MFGSLCCELEYLTHSSQLNQYLINKQLRFVTNCAFNYTKRSSKTRTVELFSDDLNDLGNRFIWTNCPKDSLKWIRPVCDGRNGSVVCRIGVVLVYNGLFGIRWMSLSLSCISHYQWSIMHALWKLDYSALFKGEENNGFQALGWNHMHCALCMQSCWFILLYCIANCDFYSYSVKH